MCTASSMPATTPSAAPEDLKEAHKVFDEVVIIVK